MKIAFLFKKQTALVNYTFSSAHACTPCKNRCSPFSVALAALCMQVTLGIILLFQTNFNTVLTREKMRKENIINDLSDKLKSTMQQQERDKG